MAAVPVDVGDDTLGVPEAVNAAFPTAPVEVGPVILGVPLAVMP